ncbi:MAG: hypothetical protein HQL69_18500 [Magnetococcales bacterium]|nr:hypothetical protein [Magnetococcales bacterium]
MNALAVYRFLTPEQMAYELGISTHGYLQKKLLRKLRLMKPQIIGHVDHGRKEGSFSYYLKKKGAEAVARSQGVPLTSISFPKGNSVNFGDEFEHRAAIVSSHIAFRKWAQRESVGVDFFHPDFESFKGRKEIGHAVSRAQVRYGRFSFMADAIARFTHKKKHRLCFWEIHHTTNPKAIAYKLDQHIYAIHEEAWKNQFQHHAANFVLSIHWRKATMQTTMNHLMKVHDFETFLPLFHFNTISRIKQDFASGWQMANRVNSPLFLS